MREKSQGKITGILIVSLVTFFIFSLGFFPILIGASFLFMFINFTKLWHFLLLPFLVYIAIVVTYFFQVLFSGLFIDIFRVKYKPGVYEYNYANRMALKWILVCSLYTPFRYLLEILPMGGMKIRYLRMLGMKIGENSLIGGTIMDPCLTEVGDNCTIGLYSVIYGHIHDYEKGLLIMDRIKIGNNCVIGAGAFIMPGAVLEDNVKLAAGAVVTKGQILKNGKIYGGIPAKEIKLRKKKQ